MRFVNVEVGGGWQCGFWCPDETLGALGFVGGVFRSLLSSHFWEAQEQTVVWTGRRTLTGPFVVTTVPLHKLRMLARFESVLLLSLQLPGPRRLSAIGTSLSAGSC